MLPNKGAELRAAWAGSPITSHYMAGGHSPNILMPHLKQHALAILWKVGNSEHLPTGSLSCRSTPSTQTCAIVAQTVLQRQLHGSVCCCVFQRHRERHRESLRRCKVPMHSKCCDNKPATQQGCEWITEPPTRRPRDRANQDKQGIPHTLSVHDNSNNMEPNGARQHMSTTS